MEKKELTAADVWAMFAETDRRMKETDRQLKEVKELIGGIGNNNGAFAENLFFYSLEKSKTFAGVHFDIVSRDFHRAKKMPDGTRLEDQFDIVMVNDDSIAIIEIKYHSEREYAKKMIEKKVPNFRSLFSDYANYKIYLGIGALSFDRYTVKEAKEYGIGLLNISGDTVEYKTDWVKAY